MLIVLQPIIDNRIAAALLNILVPVFVSHAVSAVQDFDNIPYVMYK